MGALTLHILTLFFLQARSVFANVDLFSTLYTNNSDAWLSSSGEFAFGFRQLNGTSTSLFTLAVWYDKIPDKTIVWSAEKEDNNPAEAPAGSHVELSSQGLTLRSPLGESLWTTGQEYGDVSSGAMLDNGNFVLVNTSSTIVWESFKFPTDTLLPNQSLELDGKLTSRFTESNYTKGRFQLYFQEKEGHDVLMLSPLAWPSEYRYNSYLNIDTPAGSTSSRLVFDQSGNIYVETTNRDEWGSGSCGYNSICSIQNQRPTCNCPDGYSFVDPSNEFGGCQPNSAQLLCGADMEGTTQARPEELYELLISREINFPLGDYERIQPCSQQDCQRSCLHDCMCSAAVFGYPTCWKKRLPLINGRVEKGPTLVFIKTRVSPLTAFTKNEDQAKPILWGSLIGSLVVNSILLATVILLILLKPKRILQVAPASLLETNLHSFTYQVLQHATQNFSEELGRGACGIVYKGQLEAHSSNVVAVKRLDRLGQEQEKEFKAELSAIAKTCHKNLVQLIGFCDEGIHRLLVYEYMSNGTLADFIFGQTKPIWSDRIRLALGIASGLVYLHEECENPIIHCDIKPQNILIGKDSTAKISDFGLAKLLLSDQSRTNTMIRGTKGYVAPEWFKNVPVTVKVDVHSFGVMLLEIICCRRSVIPMESGEEEKAILMDWAYDCYTEGRVDALVENDKEALADIGRLQKWVMIAIWCIQENPEMRPTMGMVKQLLEGFVEVPNPPSPYYSN
ncbi:G-type lectin S-receptor-like serine/threonine-protein kinase LECRK3 [Lotus japonicus]|uniref:G-type lectin S-receptor-like serine/threonine-protein kinase LECRK3 n=1 Tax=Lotus japonicus TaxID=34305 RepID=UPI002586DFE4|nr:G-type lectin S-receptor-like serine/threonine-protein kinase LECRK3 [Lotus japonicus]